MVMASIMSLFAPFLLALNLIIGAECSPHASDVARLVRRATGLTSPDKPTQTGIISSCNRWYDVISGDSCGSVETAFGISHAQFLAWNPAVSSDCKTNFWTGDSYCVGINTAAPTKPTSTSSAAGSSRTAGSTPGKPTMTGTVNTCNKWYDVLGSDTCANVISAFGITLAQFVAWNPAVSSDCSQNFWVGESYCVGTGTVTIKPVTSTSSSVATNTGPITVITPTGTYSVRNPVTSFNLTKSTVDTAWPPAKTQAGQPSYCIKWHLVGPSDTCTTIRAQYATTTTLQNILDWNPALGSDCSGLYVGWWVCVDIQQQTSATINSTYTFVIPSTWPAWTPTPTPQVNSSFTPSPTQAGLVSSCQAFYQAKSGDSCTNITSSYGYITPDQFLLWNPALKSDCSGLTPGYYYCVANFQGSNLPLPPTVTTLPSPVQSGIASNCVSWYQTTPGDDCDAIPLEFGTFNKASFLTWNPAIGPDCSGLVIGDYYCVAIPGTPTTRTSAFPSSTTAYPSNGVGPQPEQTGIITGCSSYWFVGLSDNCTTIAAANGINVTDFYSWNPAVGTNCGNLLPNYYVCVGKGTNTVPATPISTTSTNIVTPTPPSSTSSPSGVSGPSPTQPGLTSSCTRFYFVEAGDGCFNIASAASIALSDFYTWNPAVHSDCSGLQASVFVCIGITGSPGTTITSGPPVGPPAATTSAAAAATPSPVQAGMVASCMRFYYVESGDGCWAIANSAGIVLNDFYTWNPAVKSDCSGLQASVYVCIGIAGPRTTITSGPPVPT